METKNPDEPTVGNTVADLENSNLKIRSEAMESVYNVLWALLGIASLKDVENTLDELFQVFEWECVPYDADNIDEAVKAVVQSDFSWAPEEKVLFTAKRHGNEIRLSTFWRNGTRDPLRSKLDNAILETEAIILSDEEIYRRIPKKKS